jgi:transposase
LTAYYLKEELRLFWDKPTKGVAKRFLKGWLKRARASGIKILITMAKTVESHMEVLLTWYDHRISSGPMEGTNNKIKTMKRQAYGYRDMEFFELKILSIHEAKYALVG